MAHRVAVVVALMATALLVTLGVVSFHEGTARSRPAVLPFEFFWCEKDADCIVVDRIGCCPCQQGGGQAAVTEWRGDDLRRFLKSACRSEQVCVQVDVCRTDLRPRCVSRQCRAEFPDE